jgi:hypothetical protein
MYIYNVTIKVLPSIETQWIHWMKTIHINEVMQTGMFDKFLFSELIDPIDEEGKTFVIQYFTDAETRYLQYIKEFAPRLRQKGYELFSDQFIAFRTVLKNVV